MSGNAPGKTIGESMQGVFGFQCMDNCFDWNAGMFGNGLGRVVARVERENMIWKV